MKNNIILTFDKIKIKCDYKYLIDKNSNKFNTNINLKTGEIKSEYFSSKYDNEMPYNLYIAIDHYHRKLTIEFSSKVLLDDYPKLISKNTIRQCFENINKLDICTLDIDGILNNSVVTDIDVTVDKTFDLTHDVLNSLDRNVNNYRKYRWEHYENEGMRFSNDVKSKDCQESILIYNKFKEINHKTENKKFLNLLTNKEDVLNYFLDKTRFEINLTTPEKIKRYLNIEDINLYTVLNSTANPILALYNKIFTKNNAKELKYRDFDKLAIIAIIEKFGYDRKLIEQELRNLFSSRNGYYNKKKKVDQVYEEIIQNKYPMDNTIEEVRNLLIA